MSAEPRKPNVLLILTDDQGYGDLSRTGNEMLATPHIDALADDGATMNHFFVQPLCAPTRAEILTGRHYPSTGVSGVSTGAERVNLDETFVSELLKDAGYATGCFGKWHSGAQYPYHPCARGFDEFVGFCCGHWSHYFDSTIEHNGEEYKSEGYLPDVLTNHAMDFIKANKDSPFFCYLPLNTPHSPWQVPDEYFEKFANMELTQRATEPEREKDDTTRCALAMCENIDWNVGRLVSTLQDLDLYDDTITIYLSDNGPNMHRWNAGLRGKKGNTYEGGVRSPCSITYPREIPVGTVCNEPTSSTDFLPTLCGFCGVEASTNKPVQGLDLGDLLCHGTAIPERCVYAISTNRTAFSVRRGEYRYHSDGALYDVVEDVGETHDLADKQAGVAAELKNALDSLCAQLPPKTKNSVIPVGFPAWPTTYLETQDAVRNGTIKRSSIHPNCSWICDWNELADFLTWHLEVETAGMYRLTAKYSAHRGQLGSRFAAECGNSRCEFQIDEEFNAPELRGFDRYTRNESYEKPFAPHECGSIELPKGRVPFLLKALRMPGDEMPHIRALKLELLRY